MLLYAGIKNKSRIIKCDSKFDVLFVIRLLIFVDVGCLLIADAFICSVFRLIGVDFVISFHCSPKFIHHPMFPILWSLFMQQSLIIINYVHGILYLYIDISNIVLYIHLYEYIYVVKIVVSRKSFHRYL